MQLQLLLSESQGFNERESGVNSVFLQLKMSKWV